MTRGRARSMHQSSFWTLGTEEGAVETVPTAHGFLGTWRNASIRTAPQVHPGNVGSLLFGANTSHIVGLPSNESDALLSELLEIATRADSVYSHTWQVNVLYSVFWGR